MPTGVSVSTKGSPPSISARRQQYHKRVPGAGTIWRRMRDNWSGMVNAGGNPMWGSVIGKLYLDGVLTETEASAARLYAEITGRYDKYHPNSERIVRTPRSPSWEAGFGGSFDVIAHHEIMGTMRSYERKAKAAQKAWQKVQSCMPDRADRAIFEDACLFEVEIHSDHHADLKAILGKIAAKFGLKAFDPKSADVRREKAERAVNVNRRVESAVHSAMRQFRADFIRPAFFKIGIIGRPDERGFTLYGVEVDGFQHHLTTLIKVTSRDIPGVIDAAFLTALTKEGLDEMPRQA